MRVLVISDTHGYELPKQLIDEFKKVDLVIHAGDICSLDYFKKFPKNVEMKAVCGNVDEPEIAERLEKKIFLDLAGVRVGVFHGRGPSRRVIDYVLEEFAKDKVDVVIFGHSHTPYQKMHKDVLYFNPGSPTDTVFAPYCSYGILTIDEGKVKGEIVKID